MRLLRVYLWKEWREQRWILAALAGGLTVAMGILAVFLPEKTWRPGFTYDWVVGLCVLAALFTVGSDLLSREMRRERLQFLQRAPAGLRMAFLAKLLVFVAVMVGAAGFGIGLASVVAWARTGSLPGEFFEKLTPEMIPVGVVVIVWTFAVSAWVRNGAMALPSALLLLAAFGLPCWFAAEMLGALTSVELGLLLAIGGVGALVTAVWSFVVGVGHSRPRRFVVLGGLGVAALFFSPSWALAAVRYCVVLPGERVIVGASIGAGGRYVWLNVYREVLRPRLGGPDIQIQRPSALLVDLEAGDWRYLGSPERSVVIPHREWMRGATRLLGDEGCPQFCVHDVGDGQEPNDAEFFDARTTRPIPPGTPLEVPELEVGPADFGFEEFPVSSRWILGRAGLGYRLVLFDEGLWSTVLYYDPTRDLCVNLAELELVAEDVHFGWVDIRSGRWLAKEGKRRVWLDPETGEREPWEFAFGDREHHAATIDDGTMLLWKDGAVSVLEPETGERRRIDLAGKGVDPSNIWYFRLADRFQGPVEAGSRNLVLARVRDPQDRTDSYRRVCPALLDLAAGTIEWPPEEWGLSDGGQLEPLACDDLRMIAIEDEQRVVRYDFDASTREVLFSVDQLSEE